VATVFSCYDQFMPREEEVIHVPPLRTFCAEPRCSSSMASGLEGVFFVVGTAASAVRGRLNKYGYQKWGGSVSGIVLVALGLYPAQKA
jgi:hypothetical protein